MSRKFSRRNFLRSASATLALPFLPSLLPRSAWGATSAPKRLLVFYTPNGYNMATFLPTVVGADFDISPTLKPLEPYRSDILILNGLTNYPASPQGSGGHGAGTAGSLTAHSVVKTEGAGIRNAISVDQYLVNSLAPDTTFKSMQLGAETGGNVGNCDSGYSCAYVRNISWAGPTTPLQKLVDPQVIFDRMYAGDDPNATKSEKEKRRRYNKSVIDYVLSDANSLKNKLGKVDKTKLDEYITGVRELELRITKPPAAACGSDPFPGDELDFQTHVRAICDLMFTAFQCDMTRIITFMLSNGISNRTYSYLGVTGGHHEISHHQNDPAKLAKLAKIDLWEMEQFAYMVKRMKETPEGDGTLLDNCLLMMTSEMGNGDRHDQSNVPIVLAGNCDGYFSTGRHLLYEAEEPKGDLLVSIMDAFGVSVDTFGESGTGLLAGLKG